MDGVSGMELSSEHVSPGLAESPTDLQKPDDTESTGSGRGRDPQTYAILGAAIEVQRQLGHGFLEAVYQEALELELSLRGVPARREVSFPVRYKGRVLSCGYRADFVRYDEVLVETKAIDGIGNNEVGQVINYLKASEIRRALLVNFGRPHLEYRRIVLDP